ncbi:MAG: hypothetical protein JXP72_08750, partial [Coriobacteriia bacterium]|nr:hypothetical protein [Coriobacteriia bacterium]
MSEAELQRLGREGTIAFPLPPEPSLVTFEDPVPGERCNPGDTSRPGYFCRATDKWAVVPGELANAEKGDIVMSPSCGGIIGSLLYALKPAQFYSHTGIMIEDRSDIYHTTTPGERPEFYPANGKTLPTDGFDGNVMKYGWPGTLSQPPFEAFWGQWMPDPKGYGLNVHAFGYETKTCDLDELQPLKPPVVIKPPWNSSQQVRATLHQLADEVATINGHYRFYAYTDAKMAFDPQYAPSGSLPDHSAWALEKPLPSMCSSLIWAGAQRLKDRGIPIT